MKNSISHKVMLAMVTLAVGGIILTGLLTNLALGWNFRLYLRSVQEEQNHRIVETLAELYSESATWRAVRHSTWHVGTTTGTQILVFDLEGRLIADSLPGMMQGMHGRRWQRAQELRGNAYTYPLHVNERRIGSVEITHLGQQGLWTGEAVVFRRTVNQTAFLASLAMMLVAAVCGAFLARRLTGRLQTLTAAAEKLGRGRLATRVEAEGEDELAALAQTLNRMAERLEEQARLRKKLTGDISHELRTPLATVRSYLEAFLDGVLPADVQNLNAALEETNRLGLLVSDLQELAGSEYGDRQPEPEPLDLNLFVVEEVERTRPLFSQKGVQLSLALSGSPVSTIADARMLARVLVNLLVNANKYTPEGGKVVVGTFADGVETGFTVSDTGVGIAAEHLPYIFERFYRADPSRTRTTGGSGIGLAIVQELVSVMGGRVEVASDPGRGSAFRVILPAAPGAGTDIVTMQKQ